MGLRAWPRRPRSDRRGASVPLGTMIAVSAIAAVSRLCPQSARRAKNAAMTAPETLCHTENTAPGRAASGEK